MDTTSPIRKKTRQRGTVPCSTVASASASPRLQDKSNICLEWDDARLAPRKLERTVKSASHLASAPADLQNNPVLDELRTAPSGELLA